ncbi:FUSC family protein [Streptomyces griseosporeus]|uniref:FUSC family protein n=1 Tax=Streptomyces griseosporeus TaxID=1910 RepID=UPI0036F55FD2
MIRAVAVAAAVAIAFGLDVQNADWMPVAALVVMKPGLGQSALVAAQRLTGTVTGAVLAAVVLLAVDNKVAMGAIIVVLGGLAGAIRAVNYLVHRGRGRDRADRGGAAASDGPGGGSTADRLHLRRGRGRGRGDVPGRTPRQAHISRRSPLPGPQLPPGAPGSVDLGVRREAAA